MKTDLYTKIILTIIAICLVFNVFSKLDVIPSVHAQNGNINVPELNSSQLKTNIDGSINVRLAAADVITVKPDYGATFEVEPTSSSTTFKVEPYSSSTKFTVQPASGTRFPIEPYSNSTKFYIEPYSSSTKFNIEPTNSSEFRVEPVSSSTIFNVRQEGTSIISENFDQTKLKIYPVPAKDELNIEYDLSSENMQYLTICDMNGRMMNRIILSPESNKTTLDVSQYPTGTYIYSCNAESGKFIVK